MRRKPTRPVLRVTTYSQWDELLASPTEPMPAEKRQHQLLRMYGGLSALETAPAPTHDDWRCVADAVNLLETLIASGEAEDSTGLLADATRALSDACQRHLERGAALRLSGPGMAAVRAVLEGYAACLEALPARTLVRAHRLTERRMQDVLAGRNVRQHDVRIVRGSEAVL